MTEAVEPVQLLAFLTFNYTRLLSLEIDDEGVEVQKGA
jgi:hypothetical protein